MLVGGGALVPAPGDERGYAVDQQRGPAFAQERVREPGSIVLIRAQLGQRVVPVAKPVPQHRGGGPGGAVGAAAALGGLAGPPEGELGFRPAVEVLQREDTVVEGERAQVCVAWIVAEHVQRLVDVVERGGMVAPDAVAQPQVGQGVGGRECVACLLGDPEGLPGGLVRRVQLAGAGPLEHRQQGQHPGLPGAGQADRRQRLPCGGDRLIAAARTDLSAREHRVRLGPPRRVGHHRQRRPGLLGRLVIGADGEQGPGQAGREPVPGLVAAGRLVQFPPQQVGRQLRCLRGQRRARPG